eukprot:scaffold21936_cov35-Tisochrysis_lutea.AAC.2
MVNCTSIPITRCDERLVTETKVRATTGEKAHSRRQPASRTSELVLGSASANWISYRNDLTMRCGPPRHKCVGNAHASKKTKHSPAGMP